MHSLCFIFIITNTSIEISTRKAIIFSCAKFFFPFCWCTHNYSKIACNKHSNSFLIFTLITTQWNILFFYNKKKNDYRFPGHRISVNRIENNKKNITQKKIANKEVNRAQDQRNVLTIWMVQTRFDWVKLKSNMKKKNNNELVKNLRMGKSVCYVE